MTIFFIRCLIVKVYVPPSRSNNVGWQNKERWGYLSMYLPTDVRLREALHREHITNVKSWNWGTQPNGLIGMGATQHLKQIIEIGHKVNFTNSFKLICCSTGHLKIETSPFVSKSSSFFSLRLTWYWSVGVKLLSLCPMISVTSMIKSFIFTVIVSFISQVQVWIECAMWFWGTRYTKLI